MDTLYIDASVIQLREFLRRVGLGLAAWRFLCPTSESTVVQADADGFRVQQILSISKVSYLAIQILMKTFGMQF